MTIALLATTDCRLKVKYGMSLSMYVYVVKNVAFRISSATEYCQYRNVYNTVVVVTIINYVETTMSAGLFIIRARCWM